MRPLAIVIPSKNERLLARAIESIKRTHLRELPAEIIVVDDGLGHIPEELRSSITSLVEGHKPFCYSKNVNLGVSCARPEADIFLMNDDAFFVTSDGLFALEKAVAEHDELGIVTPVFARAERTPSQRLGHLDPGGGLFFETTTYLTFAGAYLRRDLILEAGLLDESFIGYGFEDNDYCLRAVRAGFKLGVLPGVVMGHGDEFGQAGSTFRTTEVAKLARINRDLFIQKWATELLNIDAETSRSLRTILSFLGF